MHHEINLFEGEERLLSWQLYFITGDRPYIRLPGLCMRDSLAYSIASSDPNIVRIGKDGCYKIRYCLYFFVGWQLSRSTHKGIEITPHHLGAKDAIRCGTLLYSFRNIFCVC